MWNESVDLVCLSVAFSTFFLRVQVSSEIQACSIVGNVTECHCAPKNVILEYRHVDNIVHHSTSLTCSARGVPGDAPALPGGMSVSAGQGKEGVALQMDVQWRCSRVYRRQP